MQAFQQSLRDLGYVEGQNIKIECRYTDNALEGRTAKTRTTVAWRAL